MKITPFLAAALLALALAATDADAARRFGGGGNLGKQRAVPTQSQSTPAPGGTTTTTPSQATQPAATPPIQPAPKPSFMSRWGGLLAGLGIGALLGSLFGAQMGPIVGILLAVLAIGALVMLALRFFARRGAPPVERPRPAAFAGIGSAIETPPQSPAASAAVAAASVPHTTITIPGFEVEPFVRVAKTSFIRLQAANDAGDLDDIRDFTTPEMYAEIAMQIGERKGSQKIEVVSVDAKVLEAVIEDDYEVASVRFWGLIREEPGANPEPFDEIWVVRKKANDRKAPWLIAGIQQAA